jgi:hypothetical protein
MYMLDSLYSTLSIPPSIQLSLPLSIDGAGTGSTLTRPDTAAAYTTSILSRAVDVSKSSVIEQQKSTTSLPASPFPPTIQDGSNVVDGGDTSRNAVTLTTDPRTHVSSVMESVAVHASHSAPPTPHRPSSPVFKQPSEEEAPMVIIETDRGRVLVEQMGAGLYVAVHRRSDGIE